MYVNRYTRFVLAKSRKLKPRRDNHQKDSQRPHNPRQRYAGMGMLGRDAVIVARRIRRPTHVCACRLFHNPGGFSAGDIETCRLKERGPPAD